MEESQCGHDVMRPGFLLVSHIPIDSILISAVADVQLGSLARLPMYVRNRVVKSFE